MRQAALAAFGLVSGAGTTWIVRAIALHAGIVNAPNPIVPQHTAPVAYLGGLAVALATVVGVALLFLIGDGEIRGTFFAPIGMLAGTIAFLGIGLIDDLRPLAPLAKLLMQVLAAALVASLGTRSGLGEDAFLDTAFGAVWIVVLVNAVNLTDVCDGLVAGLAAIAFALLASSSADLDPFAWLACGACLGFLVFNRPPASIFLGDAGSHVLGFWLAALTLGLVARDPRLGAALSALTIVSVFLFELVFLVTIRAWKGLPWWRGSPDHFSLRLQARGLSRFQTDALAWAAGLGQGVLGLIAGAALDRSGVLIVAAVDLAALVALGVVLAGWEVRPASRSSCGTASEADG